MSLTILILALILCLVSLFLTLVLGGTLYQLLAEFNQARTDIEHSRTDIQLLKRITTSLANHRAAASADKAKKGLSKKAQNQTTAVMQQPSSEEGTEPEPSTISVVKQPLSETAGIAESVTSPSVSSMPAASGVRLPPAPPLSSAFSGTVTYPSASSPVVSSSSPVVSSSSPVVSSSSPVVSSTSPVVSSVDENAKTSPLRAVPVSSKVAAKSSVSAGAAPSLPPVPRKSHGLYVTDPEEVEDFAEAGEDTVIQDRSDTILTDRIALEDDDREGFERFARYFIKNYGYEAIRNVIKDNRLDDLQFIIRNGVDVTACPEKEKSLLELAIIAHNYKAAQILIQAGADVNGKGDAQCPLRNAIAENSLEMVQLLIRSGANVNAHMKFGSTTMCFAVNHNNFEIVKALIQAGADVTAYDDGYYVLKTAIQHHNLAILKALIQAGANVNSAPTESNTLLKQAIQANDPEIVRTLIQAGANVNYSVGGVPLIKLAIMSKNIDIVQAMIAGGADVNVKDSYGLYPRQYPSTEEIQKLLLEAGARAGAPKKIPSLVRNPK